MTRTLLPAAGFGALLLASACSSTAPVVPVPSTPARPAVAPTVLADPTVAQRYAATITPDDLASHLYFFASDGMEGRETGTRGQKLAAGYLSTIYRRLGLAPRGTAPGTDPRAPERYHQPFAVYGQRLASATFTVVQGGQPSLVTTYGPGQQNTDAMIAFGGGARLEGPVTFAGYGIQEAGVRDDFAGLPTTTDPQWLLVLDGEPMQNGRAMLSADGAPTRWSREPFSKLRAALGTRRPIAGLLVVDGGSADGRPFAARVAAASDATQRSIGNLSLNAPQPGAPTRVSPPIVHVSEAFANALLAPTGKTVADVRAESQRGAYSLVTPSRLRSEVTRSVFNATTENVAAFLEGSDPALKNEVVVLSSHYDHIGVNPSLAGDQINNGADDDGSGTVALLEIAEAFAQAKADGVGPRRSILFLNVTGEEKGLLGSAYYADVEPLVPLENTVTNLNIDMIGRFDPTEPNRSENYVYVIGSNLISRELDSLNTAVNVAIGSNVELSQRFNSKDDPNQFYRRSDHWNFGKKGIPFIFYFTGTHEDYHGVGDEPHKIEYDRMARIARLVFGTAWQVANQDRRPAVSGTGFN